MDKDRSGEYTGGIFLERYLPISIKDLKKSQCFNIRSHKRTNVQRHRSIRLATAGQFSSIQLSHSVMSDSATPWTSARQASLSITNSRSPPKPMSIESVMPSNNLILCHPLLLLRSIFPSIRVFSNESALCIRWPKYWSFSFSISPSNEPHEQYEKAIVNNIATNIGVHISLLISIFVFFG